MSDTTTLLLNLGGIFVLVCLSGLFSGLTLGLMSLDLVQLKIVIGSGTKRQRRYAKHIYPIRKWGNLLLCTLLLGNTFVNAFLAVLLADLTSGIVGSIVATAVIVVFGEILPQSICSRYNLLIGFYSLPLVWMFVILLCPLSFPIALVLQLVLGKEIGTIYNKKELAKMLELHATEAGVLSQSEGKILKGTLDFREKTASSIMTPMSDVFMLDIKGRLDFDTLSKIFKSGHSRIPIFEKNKHNIKGLLFAKDLILINPDDQIPIRNIFMCYPHFAKTIGPDEKLDDLLTTFKSGSTHMVVVQVVNNENEDIDPFYEAIGIVTLEDVIEEILQEEINDETDVYKDNVNHEMIERDENFASGFDLLNRKHRTVDNILSPQEVTAVVSYLQANVKEFGHDSNISDAGLKKLVTVSQIRELLPNTKNGTIYKNGKTSDIFTLILQGNVEIQTGSSETFTFEQGPWNTMGVKALTTITSFAPDYTASVTMPTRLLCITRADYKKVKKASDKDLEKLQFDNEIFDTIPRMKKKAADEDKGWFSWIKKNDVKKSQENVIPYVLEMADANRHMKKGLGKRSDVDAADGNGKAQGIAKPDEETEKPEKEAEPQKEDGSKKKKSEKKLKKSRTNGDAETKGI